jgi:hypothetical protein
MGKLGIYRNRELKASEAYGGDCLYQYLVEILLI